jgi:hypothetical protein
LSLGSKSFLDDNAVSAQQNSHWAGIWFRDGSPSMHAHDSAKVLKECLSHCKQFWAYGLLYFFNTKKGKKPIFTQFKTEKKNVQTQKHVPKNTCFDHFETRPPKYFRPFFVKKLDFSTIVFQEDA